MKIIIGNDHAAPEAKLELAKYLQQKDYEIDDCGVGLDEKADFPDIAKVVAKKVLEDNNSLGILICGTGIGMSMQANRYKGIRAALVDNEFTAQSSKAHNNANIVCLGSRVISVEKMMKLLDIFLNTEYEGDRHIARLAKLDIE